MRRDISDECLDIILHNGILFGTSPIDNGGPMMVSEGRHWLQFSSNDYLGLSRDEELRSFVLDFVKKYGIGTPMGSRALTGNTKLHLELEEIIARKKGVEEAITFSTGANAMTGSLASLLSSADVVILDEYAHATLFCGAYLSSATVKLFRHNDVDHLESVLKKANSWKGILLVVDGVYSMGGDVAPLTEVCDLCDRYGAQLFVDDAHGNGVLGETGGGVAELMGVANRIDVHAGTFSKAFASCGGFVASSKDAIAYLRFTAFTSLFTKAQPAAFVAATIKAIEISEKRPELRKRLHENAEYLQQRLKYMGFDIGNTTTPITPLKFNVEKSLLLSYKLREKYSIWVSAVLYPAVPRGTSIIRIIPTARHTKEQLDYLCDSLQKAYEECHTT